MNILLRFVFRSMRQRKAYTALIIFSTMISSAMFFAAISISQTLVKIQMDQFRNVYGYSDIIIKAGSDSPSPYFHTGSAQKYLANMEYVISELSGFATYSSDTGPKAGVLLKGMDLDDLQRLTPVVLYEQYSLYPFKGMKIIISKAASEKYHLHAGDKMLLDINGAKHRFTISAIAGAAGPFLNEAQDICSVIPIDSLRSFYNARGKVDMIYLKLKNPALKSKLIIRLAKDYSKYVVKEPFTENQIKSQTDRIVTPVLIVTVILSFISVFIIYSTFRIIILERLPVIGTFRSVGATGVSSFLLLAFESTLYGIIGGLAGCVSGITLLYVLSVAANPEAVIKKITDIQFTGVQLAAAFSMAIVLSLAGSFVPILKVFKVAIKDIINHTVQDKPIGKARRLASGAALSSIAVLVPFLVSGGAAKWINAVCIIMFLAGVILLIPFSLKLVIRLLEKLYSILFGNEGVLAAKNLKENKSVLSNISLLVIGISSMFMIGTINYGETRQIVDCFDRCKYDIYMEVLYAGRNTANQILTVEGVKDVMASYYARAVDIAGEDDPIWHVQGIDTERFLSYYDLKVLPDGSAASDDSSRLIRELDDGRNIMLTTTLKDRFDVKTGDFITLKIRSGQGQILERPYRIIGFFENIMPGRWSYSLISERNFRLDLRERYYGPIYIKSAGNSAETLSNIQTAFARRKPDILAVTSQKEEYVRSNRQLFTILEGFSVITLAAGTFGILNNMIIGFIQRKRHFAVLRSIGMSRVQVLKMILVESATGGMIGGLEGVLTGVLITGLIVPQVIRALQIETRIYYSGTLFAVCFLSGIITTVTASAGPALKLIRLNLIEALKLEL